MIFDLAEYKERVTKTKVKMEQEGIEVLLVSDPGNMFYLTGYNSWSFYVHQLVILVVDNDEPIWVGRDQDGNAARVTSWLKHENIRGYTDSYVQSPTKHPITFVANILKEQGWDNKTIGVEMDQFYFPAYSYTQLRRELPNAAFRDATVLVNWIRGIKSDAEILYMKRAARILERMVQVAVETIDVGVRQCDAIANIYQTAISGTPEYGGDYPAMVPLVLTGEETSAPHLTWSDKQFRKNEIVILELAGCCNRYHCPMTRSIYLGKPTERLKWVGKTVIEGIDEALDFIKPGISCEEVEAHWKKVVAGAGVYREASYHRLAYAIGLGYPPNWGELTASMRPGDKTILQPNMTFHMTPSVYESDCGFGESETLVITAKGCDRLADVPRKLFVKY